MVRYIKGKQGWPSGTTWWAEHIGIFKIFRKKNNDDDDDDDVGVGHTEAHIKRKEETS